MADDSIVQGATFWQIVALLQEAGARAIQAGEGEPASCIFSGYLSRLENI